MTQAQPQPLSRLIAGVSYVDRRGSLLYFRAFPMDRLSSVGGDHNPASLEMAMFAGLDYINEKLAGTLAAPGTTRNPARTMTNDLFLGLLYPLADIKLFGYVSATGLRIIVAVKDVLLKEDVVRELFKQLHRLYVDAYSNPFAPIDPSSASLASGGNALLSASPSFDAKVVKLIGQADKAIEYKGPMPL